MQEAGRKKKVLWPALIFALAFLLRILHIAAIQKHSPFFDILPGDLSAYDRWAVRIVEQGWLGREIFYQDPLYPYFLALLYKIFGRDFFWVYLVQALLGASTATIIVLLGRRVLNATAGIIAGALFAMYGPAVYFDGLLLKVSLAAFLLTLSVYLLLRRDLQENGAGLFFAGLFLGLACLVRANFLLVIPVFFVAAAADRQMLFGKRIFLALVVLGGVVSVLGPVAARNYYVGNEFVLTTAQAGPNFFIGHNPRANGTYVGLPFVRADATHEQDDFKQEAEKRMGRRLAPAEVSRYWLNQGVEFIKNNPLADLMLTGRKLLLFLNFYEMPDNLNMYFQKRYSGVLQVLPTHFGMLAPFFLLGLLGMLSERRLPALIVFSVQVVYIASVIIFYVLARYRMAAVPLFCLSAGYGLFMLQNQFRMAQWRRLGASLLVVAVGFWLSNLQMFKPLDFTHSYYDEGVAYEMKGAPGKAISSYEAALAIDPDYLLVLKRLGRLQLHQKDYQGARRTFQKMITLVPDSTEAKFGLMMLDKLGL